MAAVEVALEIGAKRVFAVALDWPGWTRSGRSEEEALERLAAYAPRYAVAAGEPGLAKTRGFDVVERLEGNVTTDFGAPGAHPAADDRSLDAAELNRQMRLLQAAWSTFDRAADRGKGRELVRGPRGGGRDLAKIVTHVREAEEAYLGKLGSRPPKSLPSDPARMAQVREAALAAFAARSRGEEPLDPSGVRERWSPRYFVRRSAWHALDHAWEVEDRMEA